MQLAWVHGVCRCCTLLSCPLTVATLLSRAALQALKRFLKVQQHFEDFQEDQFDFHGYCIRKMVGGMACRCCLLLLGSVASMAATLSS